MPELPSNLDAEKATLGAVLLNPEAMVVLDPLLGAHDYYLERHNWIWEAMRACYQKRIPVDTRTVAGELKHAGRLDKIGGIPYLSELADVMIFSSNAESYGREVRDYARRRRLISTAAKIAALGYKETDAEKAEGDAHALLNETTLSVQERDYRLLGDGGYEQLERLMGGVAPGIPAGFRDLDEMTGGLHQGELTILAARPSVGKSSLALNVACHIADNGGLVLFSSLEMSRDELRLRAVSMRSRFALHGLRLNALGDDDERLRCIAESFAWVDGLPLLVDDRSSQTTQQVRSRALRVRAERGPIALLVVDYLQLMSDTAKVKNSNREQDVSAISRGLKGLARELNAPVLALSQLSRAVEGRAEHRPMLSDLRESGSLEQDADNVWFIYREELYDKETDKRGIAELLIAKHRQGPLGVIPLRFDGSTTSFMDLTYRSIEGY